jgi:hypothetical protein
MANTISAATSGTNHDQPFESKKERRPQRRFFLFVATQFIGQAGGISHGLPNKLGGHKGFHLLRKKIEKNFPNPVNIRKTLP